MAAFAVYAVAPVFASFLFMASFIFLMTAMISVSSDANAGGANKNSAAASTKRNMEFPLFRLLILTPDTGRGSSHTRPPERLGRRLLQSTLPGRATGDAPEAMA